MKKLVLSSWIVFSALIATAQEDLMKELEQSSVADVEYAFQTFKGTRLVNGHTIETKSQGTLEFIFAHRFGNVRGGLYEMYGLDEARVRLGLDYGVTDNLSVSFGRNSEDKTLDGYLKYKLARQSKGAKVFPVTITALGGVAYRMSPKKKDFQFETVDRIAYVSQFHIARKFNPNLSLQISPTYVHKNAVFRDVENNDQIAIGAGGRFKVTKSVALTGEYYYRANVADQNINYNVFGLGIDIETGGHVFQIVLTNTRGLTERAFITETEGDLTAGDLFLGFNVTRTFQLSHKK